MGGHWSHPHGAGIICPGASSRRCDAVRLEYRHQPEYGSVAIESLHGHNVCERVELLGGRWGHSYVGWKLAAQRPHRLVERFDLVDQFWCYTAWDRCVLALECHMRRRVGLLGSRWSRADGAARPSDSCGALGRFDLVGRTDASGRRLSLFGHLLRFCGLLGRWRQQRCPRKSAERNHLPLGRLAVVPGRRPAIGTNLRSTRICDVHQQLGLLGGGDCRTKPDPVQLLARYCSERRRSKCTYRALGRDSLVGGSEQ